jgi:hypothetical protein
LGVVFAFAFVVFFFFSTFPVLALDGEDLDVDVAAEFLLAGAITDSQYLTLPPLVPVSFSLVTSSGGMSHRVMTQ